MDIQPSFMQYALAFSFLSWPFPGHSFPFLDFLSFPFV